MPLDDLYFDLKPGSRNLGEISYDALLVGSAQTVERNPGGAYRLFRIGDAVAARNTHAAIYDALRLAKDI
ncbi:putative N-methylproline demethylase [compost metagenome]